MFSVAGPLPTSAASSPDGVYAVDLSLQEHCTPVRAFKPSPLSVSVSERINSVHHLMSLIDCDVEVFSPSQVSTGSGARLCF